MILLASGATRGSDRAFDLERPGPRGSSAAKPAAIRCARRRCRPTNRVLVSASRTTILCPDRPDVGPVWYATVRLAP